MGVCIAKNYPNLNKIAQIMSEQTKCKVTTADIRTEVFTVTTSIYSELVSDSEESGTFTRLIICKERKWKKPYEYEVTSEKI